MSKRPVPESAHIILVRHPPDANLVKELQVLLGTKGAPAAKKGKKSKPVPANFGKRVFPGGEVERSDHESLKAALREAYEELGLICTIVNPKPVKFRENRMRSGKPSPVIRNFYLGVSIGGVLQDTPEIHDASWDPIELVLSEEYRHRVGSSHGKALQIMVRKGYFKTILYPFAL